MSANVQGVAPKSRRDPANEVLTALAAIFVSVLAFGLGFTLGADVKKTEAVRVGVAEWVADKDGKPQFKWREATK
jgi:hypothetical protein